MQNDKVNEVRAASDIVEIVSAYIPLTKKGKNHFGVCPFHDDTNPSMSVSNTKQIYKCFSCGASGNVFNFVMDYEHVDFKEALAILAKKAGIGLGNFNIKQNNKYDKYYKMYDLSLKMYQNNLSSNLGQKAKEYLLDRKIDDELIKTFKIGLSTNQKDTLTKILTAKEYTLQEMELYGLGNGSIDLYVNRIMFPLFDTSNHAIGFSGRIYNNSKDSKYINTKETPIFKKGELLYNYSLAKDFVRKEKKVVITEGFLDVIRMHSINIKNTIALMGTAITKEQISLIKRLSTNVYLCLDGDGPGRKAIYTAGVMLEEEGLTVKVIALPDGLDPDEYVLKYGKDKFYTLYENPKEFSDYKISFLKEGKNLTSIDQQSDYINQVLDEIKKEKDEIKKELMLKKIALEFNIDSEILRKKLQTSKNYSRMITSQKEVIIKEKLDKYKKATYILLGCMLESYDAAKIYEKRLNYLPYPTARYLANEIIYNYKMNGELILADFITTLREKPELKALVNEVLRMQAEEEVSLSAIDEYILVIKSYSSNQETKRLKEMMMSEVDPEEKTKLAEKIRQVKMGVDK